MKKRDLLDPERLTRAVKEYYEDKDNVPKADEPWRTPLIEELYAKDLTFGNKSSLKMDKAARAIGVNQLLILPAASVPVTFIPISMGSLPMAIAGLSLLGVGFVASAITTGMAFVSDGKYEELMNKTMPEARLEAFKNWLKERYELSPSKDQLRNALTEHSFFCDNTYYIIVQGEPAHTPLVRKTNKPNENFIVRVATPKETKEIIKRAEEKNEAKVEAEFSKKPQALEATLSPKLMEKDIVEDETPEAILDSEEIEYLEPQK